MLKKFKKNVGVVYDVLTNQLTELAFVFWWKWYFVREHSYMMSDIFGSFLTYLPTLIRYHQMWLDLPTYPKI